jgi:hypothetical protein
MLVFISTTPRLPQYSMSDTLNLDFFPSLPTSIESVENLKTLSLSGCSEWVTNDIIASLVSGGKLEDVQLFRCCRVTDRGIHSLVSKNGSSLRSLGLAGCSGVTDRGMKYIGRFCKSLTSLDLTRCPNVSDLGINYLDTLNLRSLRLYANSHLGTSSHELIAETFRALEVLDLCGHENLTSSSLVKILHSCPDIEFLNLSWCVSLNDEFIGPIVDAGLLKRLKSISLFGNKSLSKPALDKLIAYLASVPSLTELDIRAIPAMADLAENECAILRQRLPTLTGWKLHT